MNHSDIEQLIVACSINKPSLSKLVNTDLMWHEGMQSIVETIQNMELDNDMSIGRSLLQSCQPSQNKYHELDIDNAIAKANYLKKEYTDEDYENEIRSAMKILSKRDIDEGNAVRCEQAAKEFRNGKSISAMATLEIVKSYKLKKVVQSSAALRTVLFSDTIFPSGIETIDSSIGGYSAGSLITLVGDTGSMKTMSSYYLFEQFLVANKEATCLYFEKEMPATEIHRRQISKYARYTDKEIQEAKSDPGNLMNFEQDINKRISEESADILNRISVIPNQNFDSAQDIVSYVVAKKPHIWCLDFLTMLGDRQAKDDGYQFIKDQMNLLKDLVVNTGTIGIIVNQVKQNVLVQRMNKIPDKSDGEYSSKSNQYSSLVFATFYPRLYGEDSVSRDYFYLINHKSRTGKFSNVYLRAQPEYSDFKQASHGERLLMTKWLDGYKDRAKRKA